MSDPRFARLKSDPRFRRPRKLKSKVVVDDRFKAVFTQKERKGKSVDKYGRPISNTHEQDNLKRFYRLANENQEEERQAPPDYARGEVLLESSDEEDDKILQYDSASDSADIVPIGIHHSKPIPVSDEEIEVDLDEMNDVDLEAQVVAYNKDYPETPQTEGIRSCRLAVVNLDWDYVRASHLYKICSSLVSPTAPKSSKTPINVDERRSIKKTSINVARGKVISVRIYPSDYGKEKMAQEEKYGPPPEIFKRKKDSFDEEINAQNIYEVGDHDSYDEDALRKYQLERLRYFYAVITCDTIEAATHIYTELEGTELERSANVFDMSFIPDDMTFDGECRDEATANSNMAPKGVDFVTNALRHSKVKLTWDEDDPERNQITRRTLSRKEIEDSDFKAYLASSSSESEDHSLQGHKDKKVARGKLRTLLLGSDSDNMPEDWRHDDDEVGDIDMEITFMPGLSEKKDQNETTLDIYQKKIREKRKRRKGQTERKPADDDNSFFEEANTDSSKPKQPDPPNVEPRLPSTPEELGLLIASDNPTAEPKHFNLKSILRAEKKSRHRSKKEKKSGGEHEDDIQEDFIVNVEDNRFKVLHEDPQYAIDPSHPQFKKTKSMTALLEQRSKYQKEHINRDAGMAAPSNASSNSSKNTTGLIESIKRKSIKVESSGSGKRRKI